MDRTNLIIDWGGTGATNAGIGTPYSLITPSYYFCQGFGGLRDELEFARPLAVTGQIGYQIPTASFSQGVNVAQALFYGATLQYSMPYLKSEVKDLQLPNFINHLIPIAEMQLTTPVANNFGNSNLTIATINLGVIWVGSYFQVGVEAVIPVNGASGSGVGFLGQVHLYLDDMFSRTFGQPLIGATSAAPGKLSF